MELHPLDYQKARVVRFLYLFHQEYGYYPRRIDIAEALDVSVIYAIKLVRLLADEGIIKTSPPWKKNKRQWTTIQGLKRGAAQSAIKELSSKSLETWKTQRATSLAKKKAG